MRRRTAAPDPDGPDGDEGFDERRVRLGLTFGGAGVLEGDLTPACAAALAGGVGGAGQEGRAGGCADGAAAPPRRAGGGVPAADRRGLPARPGRAADPGPAAPDLRPAPRPARRRRRGSRLDDRAGRSAAQPTATGPARIRRPASEAARAAAEGQPGWLTGRAAQAYACDAAITPIVTGTVDQAALAALAAELRAASTGAAGHPAPARPRPRWPGCTRPCSGTPPTCCPGPAGWPRSCAPASPGTSSPRSACRWTPAPPPA